jgi:hypothetical protein
MIQELQMQISGEFDANEPLLQQASIKSPLMTGQWIFT